MSNVVEVTSERVRSFRENVLGIAQRDVASDFGMTQGAIQKWESGTNEANAYLYASTYGVSIDWIYGLADNVWGERVHRLHRDLRVFLVAHNDDLTTTVDRIAAIHAWFAANAESFGLTKVIESCDASRLPTLTDVPVTWFEEGDAAAIPVEKWSTAIAYAEAHGITPDELQRLVDVGTSLIKR